LSHNGFDAAAHYLVASCKEISGDLDGAVHHNGNASYLDPGFAMPRLRLGLLAARRGNTVPARRELHSALALLAHDDADRLLLFGGGFAREALMALCQAEIATLGGAR
jgi:chemotaxis protein methyltransferase CheR